MSEDRKDYKKTYYESNKEKLKKLVKEYSSKPEVKQQRLNSHLKRTYGITAVEYDRLYQIQQGRCSICKRHSTELSRRLDVDHDHMTGKIRGLLCYNCNLGLGYFKDSQILLQETINYLTNSELL